MTVRTRYAPSPTGDPHVGNIRSAVFAWAMARANGGQFLLRLEDTDRARLVPGSMDAIFESLRWLGIDWDEGPDVCRPHATYVQSERLYLYQAAASELIAKGRAYRCFCTAERLDAMRASQTAAKRPPGYDGLCRGIDAAESESRAKSEPFVVRFRMKDEGQTVLRDLVRGEIVFENALQDDFVALKSDGFPTYHLAVVVDDHEMEITHAIRGDEWVSSAPKHLQIFEALGYEPTLFAHLPLIVGVDRKKLSKRSGDTALLDYAKKGYLPDAMLNFLTLLGWSLDDKTTIISRETLLKSFTVERVVPNPAAFDLDRLNFLNGQYIKQLTDEQWVEVMDASVSGVTVQDYETAAAIWLASAKHPRFDTLYTNLAYQPMLEVLAYLRANEFHTYIVSGSGQMFMRSFAQHTFGVPPQQVIGTGYDTTYTMGNNGAPVITIDNVMLLNDNFGGMDYTFAMVQSEDIRHANMPH